MGNLTIRDIDGRALAILRARASRRGIAVDQLAREIVETNALTGLVEAEDGAPAGDVSVVRQQTSERLAALRARTRKPFWADSAELIRHDRDSR